MACGRAADEHHRRQRRGQFGRADPGQRLGDRRVRGQHHRLRGHQAAGGLRRVLQQPAHRGRLLRLHQPEQPLLDALGQFGQQVGRVVGVHRLQDVGGAGLVQMRQQVLLVVLGQLLDDVGQPVVIQRVGDLVPQLRVQVAQDAGRVGRPQALELGQHLLGAADAWPVSSAGSIPRTSVQPTTCTGARRTIRLVRSRTASRETTQSRLLVRSIATSTTTAELAVVASCTWTPNNWPISRNSSVRCSNRRRLTEPVDSATACDSRLPTRSIGTKMGRRVGSSTTRPSTRGGLRSSRSATTMSRTLPIDSPLGPNTGSPASCATKTLLFGGTRIRLGRRAQRDVGAGPGAPRSGGGHDAPRWHTSTEQPQCVGWPLLSWQPDCPHRLRRSTACTSVTPTSRPEDSRCAFAPLLLAVPLIVLAACSSGTDTHDHRSTGDRTPPGRVQAADPGADGAAGDRRRRAGRRPISCRPPAGRSARSRR